MEFTTGINAYNTNFNLNAIDDYNKFLYDGQGRNIKELREKLNITQEELAREMNVSLLKVKRWEQNKVRMFKFTYDKLMMLFSESKQNIS